jgi:hypothetical protein
VLALAASCAVLSAGAPGRADAACGKVERFEARKDVGAGWAPLAIGDSMLLGAAEELAAIGYDVDARICRPTSEGLDVLRKRARARKLPQLVFVALGANSDFTQADVRKMLRVLGQDRLLGLVTPREVPSMSTGDARTMRAAARRWRKRIVLVDWARYSKRRPRLTYSDGIHLAPAGQKAFAKLLKAKLPLALPPQPSPGADQPPSEDAQGGATAP